MNHKISREIQFQNALVGLEQMRDREFPALRKCLVRGMEAYGAELCKQDSPYSLPDELAKALNCLSGLEDLAKTDGALRAELKAEGAYPWGPPEGPRKGEKEPSAVRAAEPFSPPVVTTDASMLRLFAEAAGANPRGLNGDHEHDVDTIFSQAFDQGMADLSTACLALENWPSYDIQKVGFSIRAIADRLMAARNLQNGAGSKFAAQGEGAAA